MGRGLGLGFRGVGASELVAGGSSICSVWLEGSQQVFSWRSYLP